MAGNYTPHEHDVIVVGGGASGLGAAYEVTTHGRGNCLLLDNHAMWGGEAKRNEFLVAGSRCGDGVCDLGAEFDYEGATTPTLRATPTGGSRA